MASIAMGCNVGVGVGVNVGVDVGSGVGVSEGVKVGRGVWVCVGTRDTVAEGTADCTVSGFTTGGRRSGRAVQPVTTLNREIINNFISLFIRIFYDNINEFSVSILAPK
jgi:hypothetical protein